MVIRVLKNTDRLQLIVTSLTPPRTSRPTCLNLPIIFAQIKSVLNWNSTVYQLSVTLPVGYHRELILHPTREWNILRLIHRYDSQASLDAQTDYTAKVTAG